MKKQITKIEMLIVLTGLFLVGPVMLNSCEKHNSNMSMAMGTEQTVCPVTAMAIDKNIWTEYKGKRVYFSSPECEAEFEKNPEEYISKLPQFSGQGG